MPRKGEHEYPTGPFDDPDLQAALRLLIVRLMNESESPPWAEMLRAGFRGMNGDPQLVALVMGIANHPGGPRELAQSPVGKFLAMQLMSNPMVVASIPFACLLDLQEKLDAVTRERDAARAAVAGLEAEVAQARAADTTAPGPVRW